MSKIAAIVHVLLSASSLTVYPLHNDYQEGDPEC